MRRPVVVPQGIVYVEPPAGADAFRVYESPGARDPIGSVRVAERTAYRVRYEWTTQDERANGAADTEEAATAAMLAALVRRR
jgi:hypothetical protein